MSLNSGLLIPGDATGKALLANLPSSWLTAEPSEVEAVKLG